MKTGEIKHRELYDHRDHQLENENLAGKHHPLNTVTGHAFVAKSLDGSYSEIINIKPDLK